ncbi:MAG: hypothetical protein JST00_15130 [Deltaproteobacteria bacterium]|nr:hypothetical protein [Deltaproteobacteria bacterium]
MRRLLAVVLLVGSVGTSIVGCSSDPDPPSAEKQCEAQGMKCVAGVLNTKLQPCVKCVKPGAVGDACEEVMGTDSCGAPARCNRTTGKCEAP